MRRPLRTWLQWPALGLFCFFLAAALPPALGRAFIHLGEVSLHAREDPLAARARCLGAAFVGAVEEIRHELGPDEDYLLVEGGDPRAGGALWVRYELAPRRAVFLGKLGDLPPPRRLRGILAANLHHVVVAYGPGRPPVLFERYRFMAALERRLGR
ncbi:MAG TPA: hypothetical protein VHR45_15135 [Thermoanaerobaculia bacterium]|nr:hypothetical protein [Thermoanaerobaculia bacterium]